MLFDELKDKTINNLILVHDLDFEEAEELINESIENDRDMWDDDADPDDLAKHLANSDDED